MGWERQGNLDRWTIEDTVRHLALKSGILYFELQGITVHTFTGPDVLVNPDSPLKDLVYRGSVVRSELNAVSDEDIWEAIVRGTE